MALAAWALGALILVGPACDSDYRRDGAVPAEINPGPRRVYSVLLLGPNRLSDAAHRSEVRDLRTSLVAVLVPTAVLTGLGFAVAPTEGAYVAGSVRRHRPPLVVPRACGDRGTHRRPRPGGYGRCSHYRCSGSRSPGSMR